MLFLKKISEQKICWIVCLTIVILLFSPKHVVLARDIDSVYLIESELKSIKINADPLVISNNDDFINLGFVGDGTISNPYLIEDLFISSSTGILIYIHDTTSYFQIRNNYLDGLRGDTNAIVFENVNNGFIVNTTVVNSENGISLNNCFNIIIVSNIILSNSKYGITLAHSNYNTIENNQLSSNSYAGIGLSLFSNDNSLRTNNVDKSFIGIIFGDSMNNEVISNNIQNSGRFGFNAWESTSYNNITLNNFIGNNEDSW